MTQQVVFALVTFLHDIFTVVWVGGLVTLGLTVLPASRALYGAGPEVMRLMDAIQQRLRWPIYISIAGLAITGILLARRSPDFGGFLSAANTYSIVLSVKHLLTAAMALTALIRSIALAPGRGRPSPRRQRVKMALLYANLAMGVLVLLATGVLSSLAVRPPTA